MPDDEKIEELREQFSGVSFAAQQASLEWIVSARYDSNKTTIDGHLNEIKINANGISGYQHEL
ncbi:hypothetical protein CROQUDRAFT_96407 [Cronartium quercuum f. sp. fusiforme G11]|uniref:Uncharacterized protein n=1 Tax=Cronartium quercuum f. sp. fusiforme G11 TaxID=708437 RepID=A0A9P6NC31_9BASI|nr:hypothetical protein CROQUDRAFT_96407 [Cronartium quercuum f. sp. fusiforme G11]